MGNKIRIALSIFFVCILYAISSVSIWKNFQQVPKDRYYFGSVDYAIDVLGNLTTVRQGFLGNWQRHSSVTSTIVGKPTFLKFEYILIGQIARISGVDPIYMYYVARTVLSLATIATIVWLVYQIFSKSYQQVTAMVIILFGTGITEPWKSYPYRIMDSMPGDALVLQRLTVAAPHYLLGILLPLWSMIMLSRFIDKKKFVYFPVSIITGILATFVYSPSMILVVASLFLLFIKKKVYRGAIFLYAIFSLLPIIYIRYVSQFWDFNTFSKTEFVVPFRLAPIDYLFAVGIPFFFALFAIRKVLASRNTLLLIIVPWILMHPFASLFLANLIRMNPSRYFFGPYFVIFGILATIGLREIISFIQQKTTKPLAYGVGAILVIIIFVPSYISYGASIQNIRNCFCNVQFFDYGYPKKDLMNAIFWLADHTKESDIVLSGPYAGIIIPAFSGNRVYTSFWLRLMDESTFSETERMLQKFYGVFMTEEEIRALQIEYVLFGDQERQYGGRNILDYPFLAKVASFGKTQVYKVN